MNIKVHNTAATLMIASALVLGLVVVVPDITPAGRDAGPGDALAAPVQFDATRAGQTRPVSMTKPIHKSGKSRRIRQSMAMPFFSFAPRG